MYILKFKNKRKKKIQTKPKNNFYTGPEYLAANDRGSALWGGLEDTDVRSRFKSSCYIVSNFVTSGIHSNT